MAREQVGIFGGTFNPVHVGHLRLALEVLELGGLDRVECLPASVPPHKSARGILPFDFRVRLLRRAILGIFGLEVSELEASLSAPSFTCNTIDALLKTRSQTEFFFILGSDDLPDIINWEEGSNLPRKMNFIIIERLLSLDAATAFAQKTWPDGRHQENRLVFPEGTSMLFLSLPRLEISSTLVRNRWRQGRRIDFLVPQGVLELMQNAKTEIDRCWAER